MNQHFSRRFERNVVIIHPGEYFVSRDDLVISTVLGSCVAVALHDPHAQIGGMNHFMLPGEIRSRQVFAEESARYGLYAMELLINELMKAGADRRNLVAKVFGGGHVLHHNADSSIPDSNAEFAMVFLETERIPVATSDLGGNEARKLFFFPRTHKVLLKRFGGPKVESVEREEETYLSKLRTRDKRRTEGDVTLFR